MRSRKSQFTGRGRRSRGQGLVEFALVIPIFLTVVVAIAEFSFLYTSYSSINYASHDAVQVAATLGNTIGADASILQRIDQDIAAPADRTKIKTVDIYWVDTSTSSASPVSGAENIWTYDGGSHAFTLPDGTTVQLPFITGGSGYPEANRCNANLGIGCVSGHTTVDTIAVKITYQYTWITPFPALINGSTTGPLLSSVNIMRLEPVR
jgi:Flp pilus assembly protein TadG